MKKHIAVLPGDGVGPEVIKQAIKVLKKIAQKFHHEFVFKYGLVGAVAIEKTGNPLPDETLKLCKESNAILFGAIGDPKYDSDPKAKVRPEQGLLKLRKTLNLYANLRPVKIYNELIDASPLKKEKIDGVDFIVVRELSGGIYFGKHGRKNVIISYSSSGPNLASGESRSLPRTNLRGSRPASPAGRQAQTITAYDISNYSTKEITRIAKLAFEQAAERKKKVTSVDKANVLETSRLWRETVSRMAKQYPTVELTHLFVDNAAMQIIKNPKQFDVILTENMFGDILTDESSVIAGSIGLLPSASLGTSPLPSPNRRGIEGEVFFGLYEPIHGAFNRVAGKNIANPIGTILSAAMMLRISFKLEKEAIAIEDAIEKVLKAGFRTKDIATTRTPKTKILGTIEMGDKIIGNI